MSNFLIISCVGQIVVFIAIFLEFIFGGRSSELQLKSERKKVYFTEKREAYKKLINRLNVDFFDGRDELKSQDLDFFYKEIYLYVSDDIVKEFFVLNRFYQELVKNYKQYNLQEIESSCRRIGRQIGAIRDLARKEFEKI